MIVHLVDGTYELFRHFHGRRRFEKADASRPAPPFGAVAGVKGGIFVPVQGSWLPTLGALGTLGIGPLYGAFAAAFGGAGTEPVRTLTQEYGATYVMVAGLLNWLCCFDLWDRITGRWIFRLPKDEQIQKARDLAAKAD